MDRTSITAMLKPLERRGWVEVRVDDRDRRGRRPTLTAQGRAALARALPIWEREHGLVEAALASPEALREALNAIAFGRAAHVAAVVSGGPERTGRPGDAPLPDPPPGGERGS